MAANDHEGVAVPATSQDDPTRTREIGQLAQVTRAVVAIYKEHFGRGPKRAHSHYAGPDSIVCYLEDTLTPVERSLSVLGKSEEMQNLRQLFQSATETIFCNAVEEITGRKVISFMSGNDIKNDVASEIFLFERTS